MGQILSSEIVQLNLIPLPYVDFQMLAGDFHSPPPSQDTTFAFLAKFPSPPYDMDSEILFC